MQVKITEWLTESWALYSKQWLNWALLCLIFFTISFIPMAAGAVIAVAAIVSVATGLTGFSDLHSLFLFLKVDDPDAVQQASSHAAGLHPNLMLIVMILMLAGMIMMLVSSMIVPPLMAGAFKAAFNQMRTGELKVGDIFSGFRRFRQCVIGNMVIGTLSMAGMLFCYFPGLYIMICAIFMLPLIIEKDMGYWQAFLESRRMVHRNFWGFISYFFLAGLLSSLGAYACGILIFATYPLFFIMLAVAFREAFGVEGAAPAAAAAKTNFYATMPGVQQGAGFCAACGAPVQPGATFCFNCGGPVTPK